MDYTASGFSLNGAYTVLTSNELLGNQKRNITTASMKDIVSHTDDYLYLLDNYLEKCRFKRFSYIDSLYENLGDVYRASDYTQFEDITKQEYLKLFGFELLDREYSGGKIPFRNKLKPLPQKTAPIQNGKIWNEKQKQFNVDLREDAQEVLKIMHSLRKPLDEIDDINAIYSKIEEADDFTIKGYTVSIKPEEGDVITFNVLEKSIFEEAVVSIPFVEILSFKA